MSDPVNVKTSASDVGSVGVGTLAGVGAACAGLVYMAVTGNLSVNKLSMATLAASVLVVGIVLWLMLTDVKKLSDLIVNNQLVAVVAACAVGLDLVMQGGVLFKYPAFGQA